MKPLSDPLQIFDPYNNSIGSYSSQRFQDDGPRSKEMKWQVWGKNTDFGVRLSWLNTYYVPDTVRNDQGSSAASRSIIIKTGIQ